MRKPANFTRRTGAVWSQYRSLESFNIITHVNSVWGQHAPRARALCYSGGGKHALDPSLLCRIRVSNVQSL